MRLKQKIEDFRVRELLTLDVEEGSGEHRVYRVTKRKLTSLEAASELAREAGVHPQAVAMAGLKDRQGVTIQHMSVHRGPVVSLRRPDLRIETVGSLEEQLTSDLSDGNAFQIVVRALDGDELQALRAGLGDVRRDGVVNYFDDQRFGNLRHGQGWIALDLLRGRTEQALQTLLAAPSRYDDKRKVAFKRGLRDAWGDWRACRDLAGKFGAHHSVFEHLKSDPDDFAGAFGHVATRLRLIHLYAYQSHLWNRAVTELVRELCPIDERIVVRSAEGPLVFPSGPIALPASFPLPGERLEGADERARVLLADVLAADQLVPADLAIEGVPGFALKAEERPTLVHPRHLRVRPAEPDEENPGLRKVRVRFELPRGAYATLLVRRLLARTLGEREGHEDVVELRPEPRRERRGPRAGGPRGANRDDRGANRGYGGGGGHRGGNRDDRGGGYRGPSRDDRGGGYRGSNRDDRGGGYRGGNRDDRGGGYRGGNRDDRSGAYRGPNRDDRGGGYRGGNRDERGGGYRGGNRDDRGGGYRGSNRDDRGGGYRGGNRDDRSGAYRGPNRDERGGGYRGSNRDDRGGGYRGGNRDERSGGYRGPNRDDRGGAYRGPNRDDRGGGYRGGNQDDRGGGYRGGNRDERSGGYRGGNRDDRSGGYRVTNRDDRGGGYRGPHREERGGGYRGGNRDERSGGYRGSNRDDRGSSRGPRGGADRGPGRADRGRRESPGPREEQDAPRGGERE